MQDIIFLESGAIYLHKLKTLIISDLHIGYENALNKSGIFIPRLQLKDIKRKISLILARYNIESIIINGDIKHDFGYMDRQAKNSLTRFIEFLSQKKLRLIKGNHDVGMDRILQGYDLKLNEFIKLKNILVCHGDKIPPANAFTGVTHIIIGHEHPAISLSKDNRTELYKCFLVGSYKNKKLIVMPSFHNVTIGTDILREKLQSPFLRGNIDSFNVYIIGDKLYYFGHVSELRQRF